MQGKIMVKATGRTTRIWDGPIFVSLDPLSIWSLAVAGVPEVEVTPADWDEIRSQCLAVQA